MSQEIIEILKAQIPLFEKMRRSAMLTYALRGTLTKTKLLKYVQEVETTAYGIIQINEHTISMLEAKLKEKNHVTTTSREAGSTAAGAAETPLGTGSGQENRCPICGNENPCSRENCSAR